MNYEEKCLALDKQLAELLGLYHKESGKYYSLPRWTQDDAEAFILMCQLSIDVQWPVNFEGFQTKQDALRFYIVSEAISKLKN
jgi:hypothetical protein